MRGFVKVVAVLAATVVVATGLTATPAVAAPLDISPSVPSIVPVFEPQVGIGAPLLADSPQSIALGGGGAHSALVRLSVFQADENLEIFLAGTPALSVRNGESASTSVVVPITNDGLTIESTADANVRVEVLSYFAGASVAPGSTIALLTPVTRADTANGLGALADGTPTTIGLVGRGGVPSEHVRAVHVTAIVEASDPTTVVLDDQTFVVGAGTTLVSTVVTPSLVGDVEVSTDDSATSLRIDVRGYVSESAQNDEALTGPGSYLPLTGPESVTIDATDEQELPIELGESSGNGFVLALVTATPTENLTMVEVGSAYEGRARGAVVDPVAGTQPQLALVPVVGGVVTLRDGSSTITVQPLGSLLGTDGGASQGTSISVTSPAPGPLDTTEHLKFDFEGTLETPGSAPLRVDVEADGEPIGRATLHTDESGSRWFFTTAVEFGGAHEFTFTIVDRDGASSTATWSGTIEVPSDDDTIIQPDVIVFGSDGEFPYFGGLGADWVLFTSDPRLAPGDVIVSAGGPNAPKGFLRHVVAIDVLDGAWLVTTGAAVLTDVFLQVDFNEVRDLDFSDFGEITQDALDPDMEDLVQRADYTQIPEGSEEANVDPYLEEGEEEAPEPALELLNASRGYSKPISTSADDIIFDGELHESNTQSISGFHVVAPDGTAKEKTAEQGPNRGWEFGLGATIEHIFTFTLKVDLTLTISNTIVNGWPIPHLDLFSAVLTTVSRSESDANLWFDGAYRWQWKTPKFHLPVAGQAFLIGPVPVVLSEDITFQIIVDFKVGGSIKVTISSAVQMTQQNGFRVVGDQLTPINRRAITYQPPYISGIEFQASAEVKGGPRMGFTVQLYDLIGPAMAVDYRVGVNAVLTTDFDGSTLNVDLFHEVGFLIGFELTVPIISYSLLSVEITVASQRWVIKRWPIAPSSIFNTSDDDPEGWPDPDPPEPTDPDEPIVYAGTVVVRNAYELQTALTSSAVSQVVLGNNIILTPEDGLTPVSHTLVLDLAGWMANTNDVRVVPGAILTVKDSGSNGELNAAALDIDDAGIETTRAHLRVLSGIVSGTGRGGGAGIGGDSGATAGRLTVAGGQVSGEGGAGDPNAFMDGGAGIGGGANAPGGTVIVSDGDVNGDGGGRAAGIGGGAHGTGGSLTVTGGWVSGESAGQLPDGVSGGGAGIGGGAWASGGTVTVSGGNVRGSAYFDAAGVGGGYHGYGANIRVTGGQLRGYGGGGGAGIGGGAVAAGGQLTVSGGDVSAQAGTDGGGAAIGGGIGGSGGIVNISGGYVSATSSSWTSGGAGIGGGEFGASGRINISGTANVFASGGGAGIGGGVGGSAAVTISGGRASGYSSGRGAGIGSGSNANASSIIISNAVVSASGGSGGGGAAGIGAGPGGTVGLISIENSEVSAYGGSGSSSSSTPDGGAGIGAGSGGVTRNIAITNSTVSASGGGGAAGIGGAQSSGGTITIRGSELYVYGGANGATSQGGTGAGIGGGSDGDGGSILIEDSTLSASSGWGSSSDFDGSAAIGGGANGDGGSITILGDSDISATAGEGAAAIGGGAYGNGGAVTVGEGSLVYVNMDTDSGPSAIGFGVDGSDFGSLSVAGTVQLWRAPLYVPAGATVTITSTGAITGVRPDESDPTYIEPASLEGDGTIENSGVIAGLVSSSLTVTGNHFVVTFNGNAANSVPAVSQVHVYAPTFESGWLWLADVARPGRTFLEWNNAPDGSGGEFTTFNLLTADLTVYALWSP